MDDMFIPDGFVLLVVAIELLAKARRTDIQSALAETRNGLYVRLVIAYAQQQSTGKMIKIASHPWGTNCGLRWLESGVCSLSNDADGVSVRLEQVDWQESAPIVISEKDLQRLIDSKASAAAPADTEASATVPQSATVISEAEDKRCFVAWRETRGDDIPSEAEDYDYMKQFGVSRDRVRALRKDAINRPVGRVRPKAK